MKLIWQYKNKTEEEFKKEYKEQHVFVMRYRGRTPHSFETWLEENEYIIKDKKDEV